MKQDIVKVKIENSNIDREVIRIYLNDKRFSGDYFIDEAIYFESFYSQIKHLQNQGCKIIFE